MNMFHTNMFSGIVNTLGGPMMKAIKTCGFVLFLIIYAVSVHAWPIPDTGQTKCYDNTGEIACPVESQAFYGQDGNYSIDPPSYTKLDANGAALPDSAESWAMVKDNVTGLIWENKTNDGSIHDGAKTFTWCDTNSETNGGNPGCFMGIGDGVTNTEAYIKVLNEIKFGGFSDWRIPNMKELISIVDRGNELYPAVNKVWFPNTESSSYWSSTTSSDNINFAWSVYFGSGMAGYGDKCYSRYARAVRGKQSGVRDHFIMDPEIWTV
jgi:hypothetical protein